MIRHVVLFRWTAQATEEQKKNAADQLSTLPPLMSGLRAYHFGPDAGLVEGNFDFAVVADFDDEESYLAYRSHPAHLAVIDQAITPIRAGRAGIQFPI
ncbi:MAG TPA: Dabb family protein [Streptosporangiaceae bacterium]|jgi:hypothetical protein